MQGGNCKVETVESLLRYFGLKSFRTKDTKDKTQNQKNRNERILSMTIEERVEKVEIGLARAKRRNRLLLAGMMLSFVLLTVAMTAGVASREDVVNAKQFNLLDDNGKTRAVLKVKDGPGLALYDANGKPRVILAVDEDGPKLNLFDENEKTRAALGVGKDWVQLKLYDENGKFRIALSVNKEGPGLDLIHENGKCRASLSVLKDGPALDLLDENGKPRASLDVDKNGPGLNLFDKNDKGRAVLGISQTTTPDGKVITYPESSLLLFDPNGNVIWMAPR